MVFAAADPDRDQLKIAANVALARGRPDQARRPRQLARLVDLLRLRRPATATTRTPSTPCSGLNAASEVGVPVKPEVWALARRYWEQYQHNDGGWAYTPDAAMPASAQHDLRGDLQPDHHRPEAVPGAGIPRRRPDPELRQGGHQHQPPARHRLDGQPLPGRRELRPSASSGGTTTSTAWSAPAGSPASGSSASTTGIARGPRSWSTSRTSSRASGKARDPSRGRSPSVGHDQLRAACSWPRGGRRS